MGDVKLAERINLSIGVTLEYGTQPQYKLSAAEIDALIAALRSPAPPMVTEALARRSFAMSEPYLSGFRLIIGFETLHDVQDALQAVATLPPRTTPHVGDERGLPPIDETRHTPEVIKSLQRRAMDPPVLDDKRGGEG